jgi:hypothetical protein
MEQRHLTSAVAILRKIHYLTVATVNEDRSPWNSVVSASFDSDLNFEWGSSPENVHSRNIRRDSRCFAIVYDSTAPEGTGEGVYMLGSAEVSGDAENALKKYRFTPIQAWINDEAKDDTGMYTHDIRVELDLEALKNALNT